MTGPRPPRTSPSVSPSPRVMPPRRAHPRHRLDDVIHTPVRLSLMAAVAAAQEIDFRALRELLEVSDSLLSQHVKVLEQAGYLLVRKGFVGKRPRTWLAPTAHGEAAFYAHYEALQAIATYRPPRR